MPMKYEKRIDLNQKILQITRRKDYLKGIYQL
jgi:hypothetical protein